MKEINSFSEIKDAKININEKFIINKGKRKGSFIIKNHDNFEGCFELFKRDLTAMSLYGGSYLMDNRSVGGSKSIKGCIEIAYDSLWNFIWS